MRAKLVVFIVHLVAKLPLSVCRWMGRTAGRVACALRARPYLVSVRNMEIAYPELSLERRKKMAIQSVQESAQFATETGSVWFRGDAWRAQKTLSVTDEQKLLDARDSGQGVLILLPHFGNWEMVGIRSAQLMEATAMYAPSKVQGMDTLFHAGRFAAELVPANAKGVMKVAKALKRGEMTFVLPDQVPGEQGGIHAPFFGTPALTMTLIQKLIQKTKPAVVLGYAIRDKGGFHIGYMDPDPSIYSEDEVEAATGLNRSIEKMIEKAPTQYQWEYKRFKSQPDGSNLYKGC